MLDVGTSFERDDLSGLRLRDCDLTGVKAADCTLVDVRLSGWMERLVVNDVDVTDYVWNELDRRHPERVVVRNAHTASDFRAAFSLLDRLWAQTRLQAEQLTESQRQQRVDGEWSFVETLRHLVFALDCWIGRTVCDLQSSMHPLGLAHTAYPRDAALALGLDLDARPAYADVLPIHLDRLARLGRAVDQLADADLDHRCRQSPPPGYEDHPTVRGCLSVALDELCQHRRYAVRDLSQVESDGQELLEVE